MGTDIDVKPGFPIRKKTREQNILSILRVGYFCPERSTTLIVGNEYVSRFCYIIKCISSRLYLDNHSLKLLHPTRRTPLHLYQFLLKGLHATRRAPLHLYQSLLEGLHPSSRLL